MLWLLGAIWLTIVIGCVAVCFAIDSVRAGITFTLRDLQGELKQLNSTSNPLGAIVTQLEEQRRLLEEHSRHLKEHSELLKQIIQDGIGAEAAEAAQRRYEHKQIVTGQVASYGPKGKLPG